MCGLIVKCAVLVVMIHIFRALGRLAGPRFSGLALGLPSTTAVVLIFCGCEQGSTAATQMAESGLLGLVAAVSLPLAFIGSVRLGWPLWGAIAVSVGGYMAVAAGLGMPAGDRSACRKSVSRRLHCWARPSGYEARRFPPTGRRSVLNFALIAPADDWSCARRRRRSIHHDARNRAAACWPVVGGAREHVSESRRWSC